jgi:hypothetical protein
MIQTRRRCWFLSSRISEDDLIRKSDLWILSADAFDFGGDFLERIRFPKIE